MKILIRVLLILFQSFCSSLLPGRIQKLSCNLRLFLILISIHPLFAQYEWTAPVQLSGTGIYPVTVYTYPCITVDSTGTIHAFWIFDQSPDGTSYTRYSQIEYRRSTDGGNNWTATENLTPEYTTEGERIVEMRAVCDSKNNVHLFYFKGYGIWDICYKIYDGTSWTEPQILANNGNVKLLANIDNNDRLYVTWVVYDTHYIFCDLNDANPVWSVEKYLSHKEDLFTSSFVFDKNNNIYAVGTINSSPDYYRPYFYFFDKNKEEWSYFKPVGNYNSKSLGEGISILNDDSLFVNVSVGNTIADNSDNHLQKAVDDSVFSTPYYYGNNNNWAREMYIDENNHLHVFEKHYYQAGDTMGPKGLIHSICKNGVWSSAVIDSSSTHSYTEPRVAFDKINNKFNTIYYKFDTTNSSSCIFYQSKQNESGIKEDELITEDNKLFQNYPNPFNSQTRIDYFIKNNSLVEIVLYNIKGEQVYTCINQKMKAGSHSVIINLDILNSGIYFYNLKVNGIMKGTKKMLFLE